MEGPSDLEITGLVGVPCIASFGLDVDNAKHPGEPESASFGITLFRITVTHYHQCIGL